MRKREKPALPKCLPDIENDLVLIEAKEVFDSHDKDFWNDLPEYVKAGIECGRKQAAEGKLTPNDEVMKKHEKYTSL